MKLAQTSLYLALMIVGTAGMVFLLVGVIGLIAPFPYFSRKQHALALGAGFVLVVAATAALDYCFLPQ